MKPATENLESVEGAMDFPWSVVEKEEVGRLEDDFTDLSGFTGLEDAEDFLSDFFSDFFFCS